jgi:glycerol-3-phosphate dehydrogenase
MKRDGTALGKTQFDLLILGGGITGAGAALDAVLRGLRVALIDKGDFASGTSSASSKLVHGGLRYLEHGDFPLVYEALHERTRLLRNSPHLVRPLRFVIPFVNGSRVPPWKWRAGLALYDLLAGSGNIRRSRLLPAHRLPGEFPTLKTDHVHGGAEYHDAQMDDARLCIEVLQTATRHGACVANYVEALAFERQANRIVGVAARDHLTGQEVRIMARQVLNATGAWVDGVRRLAGEETPPLLRPTKGVHVVLPDRGLRSAFLLLHPADGRVFFVLPWATHPGIDTFSTGVKTLLGTTDTEAEESPDDLAVKPTEVAYLLEGFTHYFKDSVRGEDVLSSFAGLRPLIQARPGEPSARSREYRIFRGPTGLLSVAGGKYTTYRHMAEVVIDKVVRELGLSRRCPTRAFRLTGTPRQPWSAYEPAAIDALCRQHALDESAARHLVRRYGEGAFDVAGYLDRDSALRQKVTEGEPDLLGELLYQRDQEMAVKPADFLRRRTRLGLFQPHLLQEPPALLPS